jgi:superkiller protein 3
MISPKSFHSLIYLITPHFTGSQYGLIKRDISFPGNGMPIQEATMVGGYGALRSKDLKKAHDIFRVIAKDPEDKEELYEALVGLSITYRELGQMEEAIETAKKAVEGYSSPKIALFNLANFYEEIGEHALAIQNYDLAITIDPNFADAYINRGVSWYNLEKTEQATRDFKNGLDNKKDSSRALANIGLSNLKEKRYEKAIDLFDRSLELDPENIHSLCGKGLALFNMDQYDESIICFDAALSINPDFYIANYYKGHIMKKLDLLEEAEEAILEALESREKYSLAWFELGEINRMKNDDKKALESYEKAIKFQGAQFEEALFQRGQILQRKGDLRGAVESYKMICKSNPYIPRVWVEMGKALADIQGKRTKAISSLKNALYLKPSDPDAAFHLASLYLKDGKTNSALKVLNDSMELLPDARVGLLLSKTYLGMKQYTESINAADDVLTQDPNLSEAWLIMGRAYSNIGKDEEYKQCLRKYLHIVPNDNSVRKELESIS